jgi:hypothetical protein
MSIRYHMAYGVKTYNPHCDACGKELPGEYSFQDAVASRRKAGWISRKLDGEYEDLCRECWKKERDMLADNKVAE